MNINNESWTSRRSGDTPSVLPTMAEVLHEIAERMRVGTTTELDVLWLDNIGDELSAVAAGTTFDRRFS